MFPSVLKRVILSHLDSSHGLVLVLRTPIEAAMLAPTPAPRDGSIAVDRLRIFSVLGRALLAVAVASVARAQAPDSLAAPLMASASTALSPPRVGGYIQARTASVTDI